MALQLRTILMPETIAFDKTGVALYVGAEVTEVNRFGETLLLTVMNLSPQGINTNGSPLSDWREFNYTASDGYHHASKDCIVNAPKPTTPPKGRMLNKTLKFIEY